MMPSRRHVLAALGTAAAVTGAGCGEDTSQSPPIYDQRANLRAGWWSAAHDPANTRHAPQATAPTPPLTPQWRVEMALPNLYPPLVFKDTIVVSDDATVRAVTRDGQVRWTYDHGAESPMFGSPAIDETGGVNVIDHKGVLRVLDIEEGTPRMTVDFGERVTAAPALATEEADEKTFVGLKAGRLVAVNRETETVAWRHETFGGIEHAVAYGRATPDIGGAVAVSTTAGVELLSEQGVGYWRVDLPAGPAGRPTFAGERVLVPRADGRVYAFVLATGDRAWTAQVADPDALLSAATGRAGLPVAATGRRFFATDYDRLHAFRVADGSRAWTFRPGEEQESLTAPAVVDGTVFVASDAALFAVKPGGGTGIGPLRVDQTRWRVAPEGLLRAVTPVDGRVYAIRSANQTDALVAYE